jgi:hypothetical protein
VESPHPNEAGMPASRERDIARVGDGADKDIMRSAAMQLGPAPARCRPDECDSEATDALQPHPVHDWTSLAADSFRYLAMTLDGRAAQSGFHRRIEYSRQGVA